MTVEPANIYDSHVICRDPARPWRDDIVVHAGKLKAVLDSI